MRGLMSASYQKKVHSLNEDNIKDILERLLSHRFKLNVLKFLVFQAKVKPSQKNFKNVISSLTNVVKSCF